MDILDSKNSKNIKSTGFTLAEVLITLVVIGVVAAIILPNLITNIQDRELKTKFKDVYSMLSQATALMLKDKGGVTKQYYDSNKNEPLHSV